MLQKRFSNTYYTPEMYGISGENLYLGGFGYFNMQYDGSYNLYHPGNGYCIENINTINYNLIFKC